MALGLSSCSTDMPDGGDQQVAQKDETRYVRVAIANPPSTRAEGDDKFEAGQGLENQVDAVYLQFYDINGDPVNTEPFTISSTKWTDVKGTPSPNVGRIMETVVQISLEKGQALPAYVMCYINPISYDNVDGLNMSELRNQERTSYKVAGADKGFAMSNSVYYGSDPVSGATNVKISGTPILASQLYTTEEAAKAADASAVDIYVERYAAKVNFTLSDDFTVDDVEVGAGAYTLTFTPQRWTVNADAASMYVVKRFADSDAETSGIPTLTQVNTLLGGWTAWNDPDNFRSYWAASPSFYATEFPRVSNDIIDLGKSDDNVAGSQHGAGIVVAPYALRYYSYNQVFGIGGYQGRGLGVNVADPGAVTSKYVLENTMSSTGFNSLNPMAAAPSVIVVGTYTIKANGTEIDAPAGFCLYDGNLYFKGDAAPAGAPTGTIMDAFLAKNTVLAVDAQGTTLNSTNVPKDVDGNTAFVVKHPDKGVRGNIAVPHRYVTLQLNADEILAKPTLAAGIFYSPNGSDEWRSLAQALNVLTTDAARQSLIEGINQALWTQLGKADAYTENHGYFSVPIRHLRFYDTPVANRPVTADGQIDWDNVKVGDLGIVRNHVYTISVDGISGLADGIEGLDNPLVPAMTTNNYYIKYKVNILNWRIVPPQDGVILKK